MLENEVEEILCKALRKAEDFERRARNPKLDEAARSALNESSCKARDLIATMRGYIEAFRQPLKETQFLHRDTSSWEYVKRFHDNESQHRLRMFEIVNHLSIFGDTGRIAI